MSVKELIDRIEKSKNQLKAANDKIPVFRATKTELKFKFISVEAGSDGFKRAGGLISNEDPEGIFKEQIIGEEVEVTVITDLHGGTGNPRDGIKAGGWGYRADLDIAAAAAQLHDEPLPDDANVANLELKVATASAEASVGKDGLTAGATASWLEGGVTVGSSSPDNEHDETTRLVGVVGGGLAARLHWDDANGDGFREFGFGGDIPFVSTDIKTEDPLRTLLSGSNTSGQFARNFVMDQVLPEGNLTESVANKFGLSIKDENAPNA